jgi:hypothetical protein
MLTVTFSLARVVVTDKAKSFDTLLETLGRSLLSFNAKSTSNGAAAFAGLGGTSALNEIVTRPGSGTETTCVIALESFPNTTFPEAIVPSEGSPFPLAHPSPTGREVLSRVQPPKPLKKVLFTRTGLRSSAAFFTLPESLSCDEQAVMAANEEMANRPMTLRRVFILLLNFSEKCKRLIPQLPCRVD